MENYLVFLVGPVLVFFAALLFFWGLEEAERRISKFGERVLWGPFLLGSLATIVAVMAGQGLTGVLPLLAGELWLVLTIVFILLTRPSRLVQNDPEVGDAES